MAAKRKYPKAFHDDGLGDLLEWIDDEVLVHAELAKGRSKKPEDKKKSRKVGIYGDNHETKIGKQINSKTLAQNKKLAELVEQDVFDEEPASESDKKLEIRARGLINRLAAQTMPFVVTEFEKLFSSYPRQAVNVVIFDNIQSSIINKQVVAKRKLVAELMLLVAYLNHKVNPSIGATLIHRLTSLFEDLYKNGTGDEDKRLDNITFCFVNLYIIGLISANVMHQLTSRICKAEDFRQKSVELLLIIVKCIGFQLRKDSPASMRKLILDAQDMCKQLESKTSVDTRIKFMMEALNAIKNNNVNKIGNYGCDVDKETIESVLKSLCQRTKLPETLSDATYSDMLNSANWYLLDVRVDEIVETQEKKSLVTAVVGSEREKKICKALGFNKPSEKTILSALLRVADYIEASNIIIGFGLDHCSDAMIVCIHLAIHEKTYNQFYYNLINNLCKFNRKYKMACKFALQDKIKLLSNMPAQRVAVLRKLCFELLESDAVPITILKSLDWANLSDSTKSFVVDLLQSISELPEDQKQQIMVKSDKKSAFAGAMRTFTNCFMKDCDLFT